MASRHKKTYSSKRQLTRQGVNRQSPLDVHVAIVNVKLKSCGLVPKMCSSGSIDRCRCSLLANPPRTSGALVGKQCCFGVLLAGPWGLQSNSVVSPAGDLIKRPAQPVCFVARSAHVCTGH